MDELTKNDVQTVRNALWKLSQLEPKLDRAEACGIPCQELRDRAAQQKAFLIKVNEIWGPQYPTSKS